MVFLLCNRALNIVHKFRIQWSRLIGVFGIVWMPLLGEDKISWLRRIVDR